MAKQKAPTLAELRKLAREVFGKDARVNWIGWTTVWQYWADDGVTGFFAGQASVRHPSRATARRMLHAALMAAKKAGA